MRVDRVNSKINFSQVIGMERPTFAPEKVKCAPNPGRQKRILDSKCQSLLISSCNGLDWLWQEALATWKILAFHEGKLCQWLYLSAGRSVTTPQAAMNPGTGKLAPGSGNSLVLATQLALPVLVSGVWPIHVDRVTQKAASTRTLVYLLLIGRAVARYIRSSNHLAIG